jgi:chemotaxis family two-component system sensor kinase Cph1
MGTQFTMPDPSTGAAGGGGRPDISRLTAIANQAPDPAIIETAECDKEPIHTPGSIQPHALLIVADRSTLIVTGGAGDIEGRLAPIWLHRSLPDLLGQEIAERFMAGATSAVQLTPIAGMAETFDAFAVHSGNAIVVELEPSPPGALSAIDLLSEIEAASMSFERAPHMDALCRRAAEAFRRLTGFDRVMIYRFLDDDAGVVIAEDNAPELGSFLHHHFPASDIPRQARALYVRNRVRAIPDVGYLPAPLRPFSPELAALDMSDLSARSVSPIHVRYLQNMGVGASASVSIVRDDVLWGLVACHHRTPKQMPRAIRMAARTLASGLSRQIRARDDAQNYKERIRLRLAEDLLAPRLGAASSLATMFTDVAAELMTMLKAGGLALVQGGSVHAIGRHPSTKQITELALWAVAKATPQPFDTRSLTSHFAPASEYQDVGSGLLAATIPADDSAVILWFRAEEVEVVNWAGNPHKAVEGSPTSALTPRASFAAWSEAVRGRSQTWTLPQVEAASRIARAIFEMRQNRRVRDLNRDLSATIADNEALLLQKDFLLKEVSHRVQNSLQLVSSFLGLQAKAVADPALTGHLSEAQRRVSAVALVHRRLYGGGPAETVDLGRYIEDLGGELVASFGAEWAKQISIDAEPVLMPADRAVHLGLLLTELVINANKYAYGGAPGPIAISLRQHQNSFRLIVADQGRGREAADPGFGSRMMRAMAHSLAAVMEETNDSPGIRITITGPIESSADRSNSSKTI